MSFKITRAAIHNRNVTGLHKLVLIILADHEGNDYGSWPSIGRLAYMVGVSERHIQRLLRELEQAGEILIVRQDGHRGTNRYFVVNKVIPRGDTGVRGGDVGVTQGVTWVSPEHIKKDTTPPGSARGGDGVTITNQIDSDQGSARPVETSEKENDDTPKYVPPRCLHNASLSALKCNQCREAFIKGEIQ